MRPGDLAFFKNSEGRIVHVGIALGDDRIIHASGRVRVDHLDEDGILNLETKVYTHQAGAHSQDLNGSIIYVRTGT